MSSILSISNLSKTFQTGNRSITVLQDINFEIAQNTSISIVGPSGSGKTTLLGLCAGLDQPSGGSIKLLDIELGGLSEDERAYVRNQYIGFVFQNFQLLPTLTALENVMIPLELRGGKNITIKAEELLDRVGLADRMHHYPAQLSGGEQQRVAIARAFISDPKILFADEPTGNLDEETAEIITDLLFSINKELGTSLVMVTHNLQLAEHTGRILKLKGGKIVEDKAIAV
jgi:putative ABC transport system ATP-binding protein